MRTPTYQCPVWCEIPRREHDLDVESVGGYGHRADLSVYGVSGSVAVGRLDGLDFLENPDHRVVLLQIPDDELNPQQARSLARALLAAADMADSENEPHPADMNYRFREAP